ncbi:MAG: LysM peptidoglycan-binding domain-containing protein [Gammaproteobacteria bacterium]
MMTKRLIWLCALALGVVGFCYAEAVKLRSDAPQSYVVKRGDTLWDIAGAFLQNPWSWPEIWRGNPQIRNPNRIYPGDVLSLSYFSGKPYLSVQEGRERKLSPQQREVAHDQAIAPLPLDAIRPFLSRPRVVSLAEYGQAPYIVSSQDQRLVAGAGNLVYVRGLADAAPPGYGVFRRGEPYVDPASGAILGYEALQVADAVVKQFSDPAVALVTQSHREVLVGDRLFADLDTAFLEFVPHAPTREVVGTILSVLGGVSQIGQYHAVVLNLGLQEGLEPGHVLSIYQTGQIVRDPIAIKAGYGSTDQGSGELVELPPEYVGDLMLFRVFERVSFALVMRSLRPAHVYDTVTNP